jgi:hypothetical protein
MRALFLMDRSTTLYPGQETAMLDKKLSSRRMLIITGLVSAGVFLAAARPTWAQG